MAKLKTYFENSLKVKTRFLEMYKSLIIKAGKIKEFLFPTVQRL
ncbi:hypothetical protein [Desulfonauticus submarinus]